ncbi:hypothetical protein ABMA58_16145, partial [Oceanospirillum sp. HFRX-1_2]
MSKPVSNKTSLKELTDKLAQVDLSEIDFKNAGSWPKAGKIAAWSIAVILTAIAGYLLYLSP